jgi:anti-sigma B factor antagonist
LFEMGAHQLPYEPARVFPARYYGETCVVFAYGELDVASAGLLEDVLDTAVERGAKDLVADLSGVTFLDSSGLGALARCAESLGRRGGRLAVVASGRAVLRAIAVAGLAPALEVERSLRDALVGFARR